MCYRDLTGKLPCVIFPLYFSVSQIHKYGVVSFNTLKAVF